MNVSRETLQSSSFLKQIKQIILRRLIQLFSKIAEEDQEKYAEITKNYGQVLKLAASEDSKNRQKLAALVRFNTNQREVVSFDSVSDYHYDHLGACFKIARIPVFGEQEARAKAGEWC